jgi:hypothetical protein
MDQESLIEKLGLMERAIVSNNYVRNTIAFRNVRNCGADERKRVAKLLAKNDYSDLENREKLSKSVGKINTYNRIIGYG